MNINRVVNLSLRVFSAIFGAVLAVQGLSALFFTGIVGLFASTFYQIIHVLGLMSFFLLLSSLGCWLIYAGIKDFSYIRAFISRIRS